MRTGPKNAPAPLVENVVTGDRLQFGRTSVKRAPDGWRVSVPSEDGETLEYEFATRRHARYIAAIFRMKPTWFPPPHRVRRSSP